MCGIFGYIGKDVNVSTLVEGLGRLEYRGYDSCGFAGIKKSNFFLRKRPGKIGQLRKELKPVLGEQFRAAILHTRWATHGQPNKKNAHPHLGATGCVAVVHNGIIENHLSLKEKLRRQGVKFLSDTDTEVISHLIENFYKGSIEEAVYETVKVLKGSYALGIISKKEPQKLIVVRRGSPLIIGLGGEGQFLASDLPALTPFVKKVVHLDEEQLAVLKADDIRVFNFSRQPVEVKSERITIKAEDTEKKGLAHFMLKEIYEQPEVFKRIYALYVKDNSIAFPNVDFKESYFKNIKKIYITACGTAYHAGYVGKYLLEKYCNLDVEIDTSSEFRYRKFTLGKDDLLIAISQSGETADTLAAVKEAKNKGARILSICNVLGSSLVKISHSFIHTLAGPEIGVASTKAYTAQMSAFYLFALYLAKLKGAVDQKKIKEGLADFEKLPTYLQGIFKDDVKIKKIARKFSRFGCFLFLGRGINYPLALEGALKLKEISYIPAEGYPAGEMKHDPI
ncbi:MAG: glutamine--fructose-6-phosphate transaminase (isomerizing), partial [Candidatus Omnitrophota bacterium]